MYSRLDAFVSPSETVYDNVKLFEIITNCSQSLSDICHRKLLLMLIKPSFLSYSVLKPVFFILS